MATETEKRPASVPVPTTGIIADRDMYLDKHGKLVERGSDKAATLLAARDSMIPPDKVALHALSSKGGKVVQGDPEEAAKETGIPVDLGTPNEGQLRAPGEPLI